jgi:LPXTG-site transpeptidase (sortase) family protein
MRKRKSNGGFCPLVLVILPFLAFLCVGVVGQKAMADFSNDKNIISSSDAPENTVDLVKIEAEVEEGPEIAEQMIVEQEATTQTQATVVAKVEPVEAKPTATPIPAPVVQRTCSEAALACLSIPAIGLTEEITAVGADENRQIGIPDRIVGWFNGSASLSAPSGTSFLDGHSDRVFRNLKNLSVGQIITIAQSGVTRDYQIEQKFVMALTDIKMLEILDYYRGGRGIALMTCAGNWVPQIGTYDARLIIYARQM